MLVEGPTAGIRGVTKMCDELPDKGLDPYEALEQAKDKGWVPALVILAKLKDHDGELEVDLNHPHYLWGVDEETVMQMALQCIAQMHKIIVERDMRREREN